VVPTGWFSAGPRVGPLIIPEESPSRVRPRSPAGEQQVTIPATPHLMDGTRIMGSKVRRWIGSRLTWRSFRLDDNLRLCSLQHFSSTCPRRLGEEVGEEDQFAVLYYSCNDLSDPWRPFASRTTCVPQIPSRRCFSFLSGSWLDQPQVSVGKSYLIPPHCLGSGPPCEGNAIPFALSRVPDRVAARTRTSGRGD